MGEAMTETPTMMTHDTIQISQNRFHIAGHSLKKWDSSTSLTVEDHCMLYPVKWARRAVVKCHERPQKKKKKKMTHCQVSIRVKKVDQTHFEVTDQSVTERVCVQSVLEDSRRDIG
jgi:hypothetical protein